VAAAIEVEQIGNIPVTCEQILERIVRADAPAERENRIAPPTVAQVAAA